MASTINASMTLGLVNSADTSGVLQLQTANTDALTIDASQRIGVGTSSPSYKLDVNGVIATGSGSNRGFFYNDGSKILLESSSTYPIAVSVNGAVRATFDSTGNLGLGVTPSASTAKTFEIGGAGNTITGFGTSMYLSMNAYYNVGFKYGQTGLAAQYAMDTGQHRWYTAPSGTAGNAISFTQAMTLDASARLGIKQTSPTVDLDVGANDNTVAALSVRYSTVPAYLSNSYDGSVGLTTLSANSFNTSSGSASWSAFQNTGYGNAAIQIAAGTYGSDIRFLTAAAANTNPSERARIDSSGNLLVGTTTALYGARFTSSATGYSAASLITNTTSEYSLVALNQGTSGNNGFVLFQTESSPVTRGSITYNRTAGLVAYNTTSDYRAKDISGPVTDSGALIDSVPVYMGTMKGATQERPMFIAHETPAYAHTGEKDAVDADGNPVYQQMDASSLIPVMWAEIQSLRQRLAVLEGK